MTKILETGLFNTAEEVYKSTIPELSALITGKMARAKQELRNQRIYFGTLTAAVYNITRRNGREAFRWTDVYADPETETDRTPDAPMDPEKAYMMLKMAFGGI